MKSNSLKKEEGTLSSLMKYFKKEGDDDDNEEEDNNEEQEEEQYEQEEGQYEEQEQEEDQEQEEEQYEEQDQQQNDRDKQSNHNSNHNDDNESQGEREEQINLRKNYQPDSPKYNIKPNHQKSNSDSNENSYYNDKGNDSDSNNHYNNIKIITHQSSQKNSLKRQLDNERNEEEEQDAFLKQEEAKRIIKAEEDKRKSESELKRQQNDYGEDVENNILKETKIREEAIKAKLKKSEEELRAELKKREDTHLSTDNNELHDLHQEAEEDGYHPLLRGNYQPSCPKDMRQSNHYDNYDSIIQNEKGQLRTSIHLTSKEEELKKSRQSRQLNDPQKTIFENFNEEVLKEKYLINEKIFDELTKNEYINSNNIKSLFHPALYNDSKQYPFHPEINPKSRQIVKKLDARNERNRSADNTTPRISRSKSPIELTLYDDAEKRWDKLKKVNINSDMNIKLNASKTKISNNSHKIAINKIEKNIDVLVKTYAKSNLLSFLNIAQVLTDLKIFRELLLQSDIKKQKEKDLKEKIAKVRERETRKIQEINFLEQIWFCLNPKGTEYLRAEIFSEFMKVLFSPVDSSITEIASILKQFLQAALFLHTNKSGEDAPTLISPLTDKEIHENDLWPLELFVKRFLELKENIIAYQKTGNRHKMFEKDIKDEQKKFTFKPKIENNKMRMKIFEKKLPTFIEREKLRHLALQELKKEAEKAELDQCTFKPKINKTYNNNESFSGNNQDVIPVYDKLYKINKDIQRKHKQKREEKQVEDEKKEIESCTFEPCIPNANKSFDKTFQATKKPRGFNKHVENTRRGILENLRKKYLTEYNPAGENYEKVRRANIQPFNITDLRKQQEKERSIYNKTLLEEEGNTMNKSKNNGEDNDSEDDYFTIQVKIPSGKERTLRIYPDDNPLDVANNFCQTYCIKDEVRDKLANNIANFKNAYLTQQNQQDQSHQNNNDSNYH